MADIFHEILKKYWGYDSFRPLQEDIIKSVAQGNDTLALMPTGGGKSITFQVPAMAKPGLCLVITPLIALMKDQVENLRKRDIKAYAIYSGMSMPEINLALDNSINDPEAKFLYCSPERLGTTMFIEKIKQMNINLLAVDESHCISQWGYDFRPSYLKIAEIRGILPDVPVLAVTATATPQVVLDIQDKLAFRKHNVFKKSFERKNLIYLVREVDDKYRHMLRIISHIPGTGIVYVRSRQKTKEISDFLNQNGISADYYNAGLTPEARDEKQNAWKNDTTRVIVATNAFGMGIDKPDVRFVIHIDPPDTLEAYFQEAGRAGRDEKQAFAIMLYHKSDKQQLAQRTVQTFPPIENIKHVYECLCYYYQLAEGEGKGRSFDLDLSQFISVHKLSKYIVHSSLKILQQCGYIEYSEDVNNPSRVLFTVERDDLYKYQSVNPNEDNIIKLILRTTSGIFTEYRPIDENDIARKLNCTRQTVYETMKKLAKDKIISYIPQNSLPQIYFTEERLPQKSLYIGPEHYLDRKKLYVEKINAVLGYATDFKCRVQQLLHYFGMTDVPMCGTCDVCTSRHQTDMLEFEFQNIKSLIGKQITSEPTRIDDLPDKIGKDQKKIGRVTRWLLDNCYLEEGHDGTLSLNPDKPLTEC
ncbi:MAG: RecQ family ATP-dependent DNA helicase [Salinivirgaceae bacterium]|nr:RecQ family ATP-dependent DNA helicase [Salinivirgaceae bacterium]